MPLQQIAIHNKNQSDGLLNLNNKMLNLINLVGKINPNKVYNEAYLNTDVMTAIIADSSSPPIEDPDKREGWYWNNSVVESEPLDGKPTNPPDPGDITEAPLLQGGKFNWFFYSGINKNYKLEDFKYFYYDGLHQVVSNNSSFCFCVIHTKPTGINDAGSFYHSAIKFTLTSINDVLQNITRFQTVNDELINEKEIPLKNLDNKIVEGEGLDSEEILFISLHSDSGASADNVDVLISQVGFKLRENEYHTKLQK